MPHGGIDDINTPLHSFLHAFDIRPDVNFESQVPGEEVILLVRAHPVTQLPWIFNAIVLLILLILANIIFSSFITFSAGQIIFANILGVIFIISYVWFNFVTWFFNVGLVTNRRIVDIDFSVIIYKEVTATALDKVEDVTSKTGGYFASLFNYGNVFVQTAGTEVNIEFLNVPRPSDVVRIINRVVEGDITIV